jgi:hypothetical protein
MDSASLSPELHLLKLPQINRLGRPRTNYFREKDRKSSSSVKIAIVPRGRSRDTGRPFQEQVTPISGEKPCTKTVLKWTKRLEFNKRPEMGTKNLILFVFDGVLGDCFKKNLWKCSPVKLYLRRGVIKELKRLRQDFQIVLFFKSEDIKPRKVINYLQSKGAYFDAVYKSLNDSRFLRKFSNSLAKRPVKYSESFQNFSQIYLDFGVQHEVQDKVLIVSSVSLTLEDFERKGENLLFLKSSPNLQYFLCKAMPVPTVWSELPVVLAVPDPRLHHNFAGASFSVISANICSLARGNQDEWSWQERFDQRMISESQSFQSSTCLEPVQSLLPWKALATNQRPSKPDENIQKSSKKYKFLILKQTLLTNYNFIQDYGVNFKPVNLKNM